jgi:hypothetical protein
MKPLVILLVISCGIFSRLIPHLPNFSPEIVFALYLGMKNDRPLIGSITILLMAIMSDILLSIHHPTWPAFGQWTLFTYSALLVIGWIGNAQRSSGYAMTFSISAFGATLGYWIWTNLGVWLMGNMYPHTGSGLMACYTLALPFLSTAIAASIAWCSIIMVGEKYTHNRQLRGIA